MISDQSFWDDLFSKEDYAYGTRPNYFFKDVLRHLKPGNILLPAAGEGRNAVYAAELGWEVDAIDFSKAGKNKAAMLSKNKSVRLNYRIADLGKIKLQPNYYHAVACIYSQLPVRKRQYLHRQIVRSLKPGGVFIYEGYSVKQHNKGTVIQYPEQYLSSVDDIISDLPGLTVITKQEVKTMRCEGEANSGRMWLVRLLAQNL